MTDRVHIKCATCPISSGCDWGCLRGDDLCEIASLRNALERIAAFGLDPERWSTLLAEISKALCRQPHEASAP